MYVVVCLDVHTVVRTAVHLYADMFLDMCLDVFFWLRSGGGSGAGAVGWETRFAAGQGVTFGMLYSNGLYSYGLYRYGLYSYGLHSFGLRGRA